MRSEAAELFEQGRIGTRYAAEHVEWSINVAQSGS